MKKKMWTREEVLLLVNDENISAFNKLDVPMDFWDENFREESPYIVYLDPELSDWLTSVFYFSRYQTIDIREIFNNWAEDSSDVDKEYVAKIKSMIEEEGVTHTIFDW